MAITADMVFSSTSRVPGAGIQGGVTEDASSAVALAPGDAQGGSFDSLMNSLLAAPRPSAGVAAVVAGETPVTPAPETGTVPPAIAQDAPAGDMLAGLVPEFPAVEAAAAAAPMPVAETLPPGGKMLPPVDSEAVVADAGEMPAEIARDGNDPLQYACGAEIASPEMRPAGMADDGAMNDAAPDAGDPALFAALPIDPVTAPADAPVPRGGEVPGDDAPARMQVPQTQVQAQIQIPAPVSAQAQSATDPASASSPAIAAASTAIPATLETAARDAAAPRFDVTARVDQAPAARIDLPSSGTGTQHSDTTGEGGARLQELLARLGGDGAARTSAGENFRSLLQGAEAGTTAVNTGALTYAQASSSAGPARDPAQPGLPVHTPLDHPEWSDEVSQRIRWAVGQQMQSVELKINPPQLGPVDVRISMDADRQMTVSLASQHALVRETLTDSLPRLRDLMSEHGFGAVNVDVSQHSFQDGRQSASHTEADPAARAAADTQAGPAANSGAAVRHETRGLVDLYA